MFRTIEINGRGVDFNANAATPYRYKQVFGEDLLAYFSGTKGTPEEVTMMVPKLAFIMAQQAEAKKDWAKINRETFLEWAEGFGALDLINAKTAREILDVYRNNNETLSKPKKAQG